MPDVTKQLIANGMTDPNQRKSQIGKDGKWQLNVFDPDLSRVEFMEFKAGAGGMLLGVYGEASGARGWAVAPGLQGRRAGAVVGRMFVAF